MIHVTIADPFADLVSAGLLEQAALETLRRQNPDAESDLSIAVEDDAHLQALNLSFLGIDAPTDVLSFPSGGDETDPDTGRAYLGDVILSYPRAEEQAAASGHAVADELQLLVVHGALHLLGHDHAEPGEKAAMWAAQQEILDRLGVRLSRLPE
jgi:probable rRNA maturation factor